MSIYIVANDMSMVIPHIGIGFYVNGTFYIMFNSRQFANIQIYKTYFI